MYWEVLKQRGGGAGFAVPRASLHQLRQMRMEMGQSLWMPRRKWMLGAMPHPPTTLHATDHGWSVSCSMIVQLVYESDVYLINHTHKISNLFFF